MRATFAVTAILAASTAYAIDGPSEDQIKGLIGSFLKETVYLNRMSDISECAVNSKGSIDAVRNVWDSFAHGEEFGAIDHGLKAAIAIS